MHDTALQSTRHRTRDQEEQNHDIKTTYPHQAALETKPEYSINQIPAPAPKKRLTRMLEESNNTGASEAGPCILFLFYQFLNSPFPFFLPNSSSFQLSPLGQAEPSRAMGQDSARRRRKEAAKERENTEVVNCGESSR